MWSTIIDIDNLTASMVITALSVALGTGILIALIYYFFGERKSKGFTLALILLPVIVQALMLVMMAVKSSAIAIATFGIFALIKFRSMPGTAKDISAVFATISCGVAAGLGYIWIAMGIALITAVVFIIIHYLPIKEEDTTTKKLRIVIPEDVDYYTAFDDIFEEFTNKHELVKVKTTDLGSMFDLTYTVKLKKAECEKGLLDELRHRNGNLPVMIYRPETNDQEQL